MALGHRGARRVEVVPVQQDRQHRQDPEQEPAGAGSAERGHRAAVPGDVPRGGHQVGHHSVQVTEQPSGQRSRLELRAEEGTVHRDGDQAGRHIAAAGHQQGDGGAALGVTGGRVQAEGDDAADRPDHPAHGR